MRNGGVVQWRDVVFRARSIPPLNHTTIPYVLQDRVGVDKRLDFVVHHLQYDVRLIERRSLFS